MEIWRQFLSELEQELTPEVVQKWVPKIISFDAANIFLEPQDSFQAAWFEEHVRPKLKLLKNNNNRPIKVHLKEPVKSKKTESEKQTSEFGSDLLDPEMTLENFIPDEKNLVAYKLLKEDDLLFNPIFLYGPSGSGKTHLLQAIAHRLQAKGKKVFYIKAEHFTSHVVQAIRVANMQNFRKVYRDIDVLIVDDIHYFSKKAATQEEFFHTFNALHTIEKQILLSANTSPSSLEEIEPRLISRFEWGITLGIEKADPKKVLEKKALLWNIALKDDVKNYLLNTFKDPLTALQALAIRSHNVTLSLQLAEKLLKDLVAHEESTAITSDTLIKKVATFYGICSEDILGKSQQKEFTLPRQIAMYLCRDKLKMAYQKIGQLFGRDHSTVMSSVKLIESKKGDLNSRLFED